MSDKKELFFLHALSVLSRLFFVEPYTGAALFNSSKAVEGECIGPAFFPAWITTCPHHKGVDSPAGS